jgi:hypothetical protein
MIAMQRIGLYASEGAMPLPVIMEINGPQILEDWICCKELLKKIREENKRTYQSKLPFQRRHAEWLACVAAIWCKNNISGCELQIKIIENDMKQFGGTIAREREIRETFGRVNRTTCKEIRKILEEDSVTMSCL